MCYQANTHRQGSLFPGDIMILIRSSFFPFFLPFLKSISGINMFHSKSCKESVFLQSAALLAALLQPICESTVCDQIRCTTRCLFCCQEWNIRSHWTVTSQIILNKYMEINIITLITLITVSQETLTWILVNSEPISSLSLIPW